MKKFLSIAIGIMMVMIGADAQTQKLQQMLRHNDSLMTVRYRSGNIDTNYITRPTTKWTIVARMNVSGAKIETEGMDNGIPFKSEMKADY